MSDAHRPLRRPWGWNTTGKRVSDCREQQTPLRWRRQQPPSSSVVGAASRRAHPNRQPAVDGAGDDRILADISGNICLRVHRS
jgi:hypothetical protein